MLTAYLTINSLRQMRQKHCRAHDKRQECTLTIITEVDNTAMTGHTLHSNRRNNVTDHITQQPRLHYTEQTPLKIMTRTGFARQKDNTPAAFIALNQNIYIF